MATFHFDEILIHTDNFLQGDYITICRKVAVGRYKKPGDGFNSLAKPDIRKLFLDNEQKFRTLCRKMENHVQQYVEKSKPEAIAVMFNKIERTKKEFDKLYSEARMEIVLNGINNDAKSKGVIFEDRVDEESGMVYEGVKKDKAGVPLVDMRENWLGVYHGIFYAITRYIDNMLNSYVNDYKKGKFTPTVLIPEIRDTLNGLMAGQKKKQEEVIWDKDYRPLKITSKASKEELEEFFYKLTFDWTHKNKTGSIMMTKEVDYLLRSNFACYTDDLPRKQFEVNAPQLLILGFVYSFYKKFRLAKEARVYHEFLKNNFVEFSKKGDRWLSKHFTYDSIDNNMYDRLVKTVGSLSL